MAATHDIVTAGDTNVTGWGGSAVNTTARSYAAAQTMTDAQAIAGVVTNNGAVLKASSTAAEKAQVAGTILDNLIASLDLGSPAARKATRLKAGLEELEDIIRIIGV